jgi:hypothetical protein
MFAVSNSAFIEPQGRKHGTLSINYNDCYCVLGQPDVWLSDK